MSDISLTSAMRANLLQLQTTERLIDRTQQRISTGKEINSALDGPAAFFAAKSLTDRANDLNSLKDSMGQAISTIKAADNAITAITDLVNQAKALANTARQNLGTDDAAVSARASNATQFNELLNQINSMVTDASYAGKNLLLGDGAVYDASAASKENVDALTGLSKTSVAGIGGGTSSSNIAVAVTGVVDETLASLSAVEDATDGLGLTASSLSATSFTSTGDISVSVQSDATNTQWTSANADSTYSSTAANLASAATYTQYLTSEGSVTTAESTLGISSTSVSQAQDTNAITLKVASDGVTTTFTADSSTTTDFNAAQTTADSTASYDVEHYLVNDADVTSLAAAGITLDSNAVLNLDADVIGLKFDVVSTDISTVGAANLNDLTLATTQAITTTTDVNAGSITFGTDATSFVDGRTYTLTVNDGTSDHVFSVTGDAGNTALDSLDEIVVKFADDLKADATFGAATTYAAGGSQILSFTAGTANETLSFTLAVTADLLTPTVLYADGTSDTVAADPTANYSTAYGTYEANPTDDVANRVYSITQDSGGVATIQVDIDASVAAVSSTTVDLTQVRYSSSGVDAGATKGTSNLDIGIVKFGDAGLAASQAVKTADIVLEDNREIKVTQGTLSYTRAVVPDTGEGTLKSGTQNFVLSNGATVNVDVDLNVLAAGSANLAAYTVTAAGTSNDLEVVFNEKNTSSVTISSTDASTEGLGVAASANSWGDAADIDQALTQLDSALASLRNVGQTLTSNLSVVQTREDFTTTFVNTLEEGADKWLLADSNKEGANLLILQTRQQLGTISLSIASQSAQSILRLFG